SVLLYLFFFQAEDGIRDFHVTGVQTCALPIYFLGHFALTGHLLPLLKSSPNARIVTLSSGAATLTDGIDFENLKLEKPYNEWQRSEERRVGKKCRYRGSTED